MALYAIGDLHLSLGTNKPMDIFGLFELPGIPGMRMVVFSMVLLAIILYRREGIMGTRELTWKRIGAFLRRHKA